MISIVVPVYEMYGKGVELLKRNLESIAKQTYTDYEIVIPDNSKDDVIADYLKTQDIKVNYFKNSKRGMAQNTNAGILASKGELIKILYQDDYFAHKDSLKQIVENFKEEDNWLVTGCLHREENGEPGRPHFAIYNHQIYTGNNTIGSPSVLTIRNKQPFLFDEAMTWVLDCDYYMRLYKKFGLPHVIYDLNVVMGLGRHQTTNALSEAIKRSEVNYMLRKYE